MQGKEWEELLTWKLTGSRFDEHEGVDLQDLAGLVILRDVLIEITKALWRRNGQGRAPRNRPILLRIRGFVDGCQQATIKLARYVPLGREGQTVLGGFEPLLAPTDEFTETVHEATETLITVISSLNDGKPLPDWFPATTLARLPKLFRTLQPGEAIQLVPAKLREPIPVQVVASASAQSSSGSADANSYEPYAVAARRTGAVGFEVNASVRERLEEAAHRVNEEIEKRMEARAVSGEVWMVSLDGVAQLHLDDSGDDIELHFSRSMERKVTQALHEHDKWRLRARGKAYLDKNGTLLVLEAEKVGLAQVPSLSAPSEAMFEALATEDPEKLVSMIRSGELTPGLLTYAVEIAGRVLATDMILPALLELANHPKPVVREGVIYGLSHHRTEEATAALVALQNDASAAVRGAALAALQADLESEGKES
jgi:hypothetical protein